MPHLRPRHAAARIKKLASLWPIVGAVGPRQVGKTTLLENLHLAKSHASLDDESVVADAMNSAKDFLARLETPALIDEVQKVPKLFDALKLAVHKKRKPGSYYVTGSVSFSEGAGIRESLTGRIGICRVFPLTLAEATEHTTPPVIHLSKVDPKTCKPRFSSEELSQHSILGGMPIQEFRQKFSPRKVHIAPELELKVPL